MNAYKYSNSSYLKPHIQFIIANNYEKMNNIEEAVKYFEEYEKENKDKTKEEDNYMAIYSALQIRKYNIR